MGNVTVPLVDLSHQHARIEQDVNDGFERVLKNGSFVLGAEAAEFESVFADFCGVRHVVGCANGTDALEIALQALGIGAGDEVIVPANTFVATAEAVVRVGARLVLADCDEDHLIDVDDVAARVSARTRAVIAVHLYGQPAPVERLRAAVGPDIAVVEDAAQAQGARRHGARAGSLGEIAGTSFYPGKNLGAYGDAGGVITDDDTLAETARRLRNHGGVHKYEHLDVGRNSRLDELQAVVLNAKLRRLDDWNAQRREAADRYAALLADLDVQVPVTVEGNEHVWHLYVVRVRERDRVLADLAHRGIGAGIHYPRPVHLLPAFGFLGLAEGSYPTAELLAGEILTLPLFPGITSAQQEAVVDALAASLA